jgi:hypothetical protein
MIVALRPHTDQFRSALSSVIDPNRQRIPHRGRKTYGRVGLLVGGAAMFDV